METYNISPGRSSCVLISHHHFDEFAKFMANPISGSTCPLQLRSVLPLLSDDQLFSFTHSTGQVPFSLSTTKGRTAFPSFLFSFTLF